MSEQEHPLRERRRVRAILVGAAALLGLAGVVVVVPRQVPPNVDLDCVFHGETGFCTAILEPPAGQCAALASRVDPGGVSGRVLRMLAELDERRAITSWVVLPIVTDAGTPTGCFVEVRLTVERKTITVDGQPRRVLDGQAPAWRDVVDAAGAGSIVRAGHVARRPAYARASGCRRHVYFGEDPCAFAEEIADGGYIDDPDGGT
jgi:hypothetical protein